jgi:hypothetical protein
MILREGLGFKQLSQIEQQVYKIMLKAFSSMQVSFNITHVNRNVDLMKVMLTVLGDNPSLFTLIKQE